LQDQRAQDEHPRMGNRLFVAVVLGCLVPLAPSSAAVLPPSSTIRLGTHRFGHLRAPEAVVARAARNQVAFDDPEQGAKTGPWSFQVAPDRSIWLLDELNRRLLIWSAGRPSTKARTVALPFLPIDFALGPAGSIYVTRQGLPGGLNPIRLYRLTSTGTVIWQSYLATPTFNIQLRVGPDGTLYWVDPNFANPRRWVPAATRDGRPLSVSAQRKRAGRQPLRRGLRLTSAFASRHELRFALLDRAGRTVRAWRVTSRTAINLVLGNTPDLVRGDPVVIIETTATIRGKFRWEYVVLRLVPRGRRGARFTLAHASPLDKTGRAAWGDVITDVRVGPDRKLYQLGSSPTIGVRIRRFSLARR
jgi:hypothetical protein